MRLLTRADFDGMVCAVLLKEAGVTDAIDFAHPKDMQDGMIEVTENDAVVNLPYAEGCGLWFDHHSSEAERNRFAEGTFIGAIGEAPSTARLIYDYYGGREKFGRFEDLLQAVDKADSAMFSREEILNPTGWVMLSFLLDPRTGLGRETDFRIGYRDFLSEMIDHCRSKSLEEIMALPDVKEREKRYLAQNEKFIEMVKEHTDVDGNVIITDLRGVTDIYSGNRFIVYSLYPEQNVSIWLVDGKDRQNCVFAVGHSIINRTCQADIGSILLEHGGGGHKKVGTCQVLHEMSEQVLHEICSKLQD